MNEGLIENVRALTPKVDAGIARLAENPNIGEWRGKGLMGARGLAVVPCPPFPLTGTQMDEMFDKLEKALKKVFAEVA